MKTKLVIPPDVKTFIEDVLSEHYPETERDNEVTKFISLLHYLCCRKATMVGLVICGGSYSGDYVHTKAFSGTKTVTLTKEEKKVLEDFGWAAADFIFPEYEEDQGGGVDMMFNFDSVEDHIKLLITHCYWRYSPGSYTELGF